MRARCCCYFFCLHNKDLPDSSPQFFVHVLLVKAESVKHANQETVLLLSVVLSLVSSVGDTKLMEGRSVLGHLHTSQWGSADLYDKRFLFSLSTSIPWHREPSWWRPCVEFWPLLAQSEPWYDQCLEVRGSAPRKRRCIPLPHPVSYLKIFKLKKKNRIYNRGHWICYDSVKYLQPP